MVYYRKRKARAVKKNARVTKKAVRAIARKEVFKIADVKATDILETTTTFARDAPIIKLLSSIAEGTDDNTRVGDEVMCKQLEVGFCWSGATGVSGANSNYSGNCCRCTVVKWHNRLNNTAPTLANIFQNTTYVESAFHFENKRRKMFSVVYDKYFQLDVTSAGFGNYTNKSNMANRFTKKFKRPFKISYTSSAATDTGDNNLYILIWCDVAVGSPLPFVDFYSRVSYTDT